MYQETSDPVLSQWWKYRKKEEIYQASPVKAGEVANALVDVLRSKQNIIILSGIMSSNNNFHGDGLSHHLQRLLGQEGRERR